MLHAAIYNLKGMILPILVKRDQNENTIRISLHDNLHSRGAVQYIDCGKRLTQKLIAFLWLLLKLVKQFQAKYNLPLVETYSSSYEK